jgi:hypothetical protein
MRRISIPMDVAVLVLGRSPGPNYSTQVLAARSGAALMSLCLRNYDRCYRAGYDPDSPLPLGSAVGYCWAPCDANHEAVDQAFGSAKASSRA